eukprot:scaffold24992_cov63-Phaeocystis_antarctica.AAC.3
MASSLTRDASLSPPPTTTTTSTLCRRRRPRPARTSGAAVTTPVSPQPPLAVGPEPLLARAQYVLPDAAYPPSLIVSNDDYLLSAINLSEPQYALPNATYQPYSSSSILTRRAHFGRHAQRTASGECIEPPPRVCPHARWRYSINLLSARACLRPTHRRDTNPRHARRRLFLGCGYAHGAHSWGTQPAVVRDVLNKIKDDAAHDLVGKMLQYEPSKRPSIWTLL